MGRSATAGHGPLTRQSHGHALDEFVAPLKVRMYATACKRKHKEHTDKRHNCINAASNNVQRIHVGLRMTYIHELLYICIDIDMNLHLYCSDCTLAYTNTHMHTACGIRHTTHRCM